jgi:hypothetical protein
VAIGDVTNIIAYGEQTVDHLPSPMAPWVHTLYWCQGDFRLTAVVKGELGAGPRRYLWASGLAGCKLYPNDPEMVASRYKTRAWFLRNDGEFLRPLYDYGTSRLVGFCVNWDDGPALPARQRLGALLLTPAANCEPTADYAQYFLEQLGDLACEVLGKDECVQRIRALSRSGEAPVRAAACEYLKGQLEVPCR